MAANLPNLPDPQLEEAERAAYWEQLRVVPMTVWLAGVPMHGNACIVVLRLAPPGDVLEPSVLEPCTLDHAWREMMLSEIRRADFTIEGEMRFFNGHALIGLRK